MNLWQAFAIELGCAVLLATVVVAWITAVRFQKYIVKWTPNDSYLRVEGHSLHGRLVLVDERIGWEKEIARWGLDEGGRYTFNNTQELILSGIVYDHDEVAARRASSRVSP